MNISMRYFLIVAEELNISHAADRLFVSQQCVSSHIKKLEEHYQAELFIRKPTFHLTPEGEALRRSLLRQQVLESSLSEELSALKKQHTNRIRIGIHNTRAVVLLPRVIGQFKARFPDALIEIYQGSTSDFEAKLLNGELDLFIATDTIERLEFKCVFLRKEQNFLVSSASFLKTHGMDSIAISRRIFSTQLSAFPFICSPDGSYLQTKIDGWLATQKVTIRKEIKVDTYQMQLLMAAQNVGVCFCPQMFLPLIADLNRSSKEESRLLPISIDGFDLPTELSIIMHRDAYQSPLLREFSSVLTQALSDALDTEFIS
mgnify:CR=1 FL=1